MGLQRLRGAIAGGQYAFPQGLFGRWMKNHFGVSNYRFAAAEFGTHSGIRVLGALRAENRAHHHCAPGDPQLVRVKREILECFCPSAPDWRRRVVCSGLEIIERGSRALLVKRKARILRSKRKPSE
jgi:hypothetical protein